jgi:hypothetical protein
MTAAELQRSSLTTPCLAQLYGNPLEVLPELSPCASLRHISLANARISADEDFDNWTVEVLLGTLSYVQPLPWAILVCLCSCFR